MVAAMAATYQVAPPEPFDFTHPADWPKWIRRFERFRKASGLESKSEEAQVNTLVYSMGDEADDILHSFNLSEEDSKKYQTVKSKFDSHFVKKKNVIFERAKFNQRTQENGEPVDTFITALYTLAEHCNYGALHDEMIRDRIVVGIKDATLSMRLQLDAELTLEKAVTETRQSESVKQQQPVVRANEPNGQHVRKVTKPNDSHKQQPRQTRGFIKAKEDSMKEKCMRCGRIPAHDRQICPAREALCRKCGKKGHFQVMCRSTGKVRQISTQYESPEKQDHFLGAIGQETKKRETNPWLVTVKIDGKPAQFHIDTGAEITAIGGETHARMGNPRLLPANIKLKGPDNKTLLTIGQFTATLARGSLQSRQKVYVIEGLDRDLLGGHAITHLQLIARINSIRDDPYHTQEALPEKFSKYKKLFQGLGKLQGDYQIKLDKDATPYALNTPRRVSIPRMKAVKKELERMEAQGVIERVTQPTSWCAGMVVVPKDGGRVRICVDLTQLNKSVKRERHVLPAVDHILSQLAGAKIFSKLDANSGFWQIPLSPKSALLTTFITPFGRFCFRRLPFGITSASEHFQRRMSEILEGLEGVLCMVDDILIHGSSQEEHDRRVSRVLERIQEAGLTLNREKCQFSQNRVSFLGQIVDEDGIRPDPNKVRAILDMPCPTSVAEVRRFMGTVNQMSKFIPHMADTTKPICELLQKDQAWTWNEAQEDAFRRIKVALTTAPVLAVFDPEKETTVAADASSYGLGAVLLQEQADGSNKPVAYVSRSLTPTEQKYAQIEKEALAFTWACERLQGYLLGLKFHIHTDHKPLVPLFSTKHLEQLPIRVQRFRLRMMRYDFTISHVPGKELYTADMLSRAPVGQVDDQDESFRRHIEAFVNSIMEDIPASSVQIEKIKQHQRTDHICQEIKKYCTNGWPSRRNPLTIDKTYHELSNEISIENDLLLRGQRIIIPKSLQKEMLQKIHSGHQGITKCRERARQAIWWPGISTQLKHLIDNCHQCLKNRTAIAQPLIPSTLPALPWQKVGTDLFEWKKSNYLLIVDYYSRYIEVARLTRTTTSEVINHTKSIFARHGIPDTVISDNGPQFSCEEYKRFAKDYEFEHRTSSPYHPQGNGEAERAVKTIKNLLKKEDDPYKALLAYRSTPLELGYSPSELLMCRKLRCTVPLTEEQRRPNVPKHKKVLDTDQVLKQRQKRNFDSRHGAKEQIPPDISDHVWMKSRQTEGLIAGENNPRSFEVQTMDGSFRRHQSDLVPLPTSEHEEPVHAEPEPAHEEPCNQRTRSLRDRRSIQAPNRYDPSWS